jgi:hypothetical protein
LFFTDSILGVKFMNNLELLGEIKGRLEREVWYQELRLNAKNPTFHMSVEATEVAINRKELAEGILKLIEKGAK